MNVLAVGAHFDDLELGCGGALARHNQNGDKVIGFVATDSGYGNQRMEIRKSETALEEAKEASAIIGYQLVVGQIPTFFLEDNEQVHIKLLEIIERNNTELIYTHWIYDVHHDHRNLALATLHVAKHVNKVLMYRSNWYSSECAFKKNFYIDVTGTWELKEQAIKAYQSEYKRVGTKWVDYFKREALNNGLEIGTTYAEAFQAVKWSI